MVTATVHYSRLNYCLTTGRVVFFCLVNKRMWGKIYVQVYVEMWRGKDPHSLANFFFFFFFSSSYFCLNLRFTLCHLREREINYSFSSAAKVRSAWNTTSQVYMRHNKEQVSSHPQLLPSPWNPCVVPFWRRPWFGNWGHRQVFEKYVPDICLWWGKQRVRTVLFAGFSFFYTDDARVC